MGLTLVNSIVIIGIILVVIGVIVVVVARRNTQVPGSDRERFVDPLMTDEYRKYGPTSVAPGAILNYGGSSHVVRGSLELSQGPFRWWEHLVDGGADGSWFGVEEDEGEVILTWWRKLPGSFEPANPMVVDGVEYWEEERGTARYTAIGTTGLPPEGSTDFVDYKSGDGRLLGLERYGDSSWEASTGIRILPGEIDVLAAPDHNPGTDKR